MRLYSKEYIHLISKKTKFFARFNNNLCFSKMFGVSKQRHMAIVSKISIDIYNQTMSPLLVYSEMFD